MPVYRVVAVLCLLGLVAPPAWARGSAAPSAAALGLEQALDLGVEAVLIVMCSAFALMLSTSVQRQ